MRVRVIGGGLAGSLLAWRLVEHAEVTLVTGEATDRDATALSGGLVRACDPDPAAAASLATIRADLRLRHWADYHEIGSLYRGVDADPVWEPEAGYIDPNRLRGNVQLDFQSLGGTIRTTETFAHAAVTVLAAGAWTPELLRARGLPVDGLRTKVIQCGVYAAEGALPPAFVFESSGLYGRPVGADQMLLGLPTDRWDQPPEFLPTEESEVRKIAEWELPHLRLGALVRPIAGQDAYSPNGRLELRRVTTDAAEVWTFTGGSGGAAKTAVAASARAAEQLLSCSRLECR